MRDRMRVLFQLSTAVVFALAASGCAKEFDTLGERFALSCGASDQYGGYLNPIDARQVVTVSLDSDFTPTELAKIEAAIQTWNSFSETRVAGRPLFQTVTLAISASSAPPTADSCNFPGSGSAIAIIKETNAAKWSEYGLTNSNPGVTIRCSAGKGYVARQVILINTEYALGTQLESILLHELGHGIGLDHSCSADGSREGLVKCDVMTDESDRPDYYEAVMYPWLRGRKEVLRANDEERASCILGAAISGL